MMHSVQANLRVPWRGYQQGAALSNLIQEMTVRKKMLIDLLVFLVVRLTCSIFGVLGYCACALIATNSDGSVRLFSRSTSGNRVRGIVEVLFNSRWGLMCRPTIEGPVIQTVCSELNYNRDSSQYFDVK